VGLAFANVELGEIDKARSSMLTARQLDPSVKNLEKVALRIREVEASRTPGPRLPQ
jgi:hypothetical protein